MSGFLSGAWPWVLTVAGIMFLIVIHEFGHFLAAKATGMRVERFFLFFPPKLVSIKRGETEYGIGAIPFGGFVKITGMSPDEVEPRRGDGESRQGLLERVEGAGQRAPREPLAPDIAKRAYYNQPVWKRIVVIAAGPAMNVLLAFVILFAISFSLEKSTSKVGAIESGTPAAQQLQSGDKIVAVDGKSFPDATPDERRARFIRQVASHKCAVHPPTDGCKATTPVHLKIERDGQIETLAITPVYDSSVGRTRLGFSYGTTSVGQAPGQAIGTAADNMWRVTSGTIGVFGKIFQAQERKKIHGIVGISTVTQQAFQFGPKEALFLVALLSLSLAIINLFPFLPLDGGHIFWSLVEKIRGKRVPFSVMERASAVGFLLIMILFAIGLTNDIHSLNNGGLRLR